MKLTLASIKEIKRNSNSPLLKRVCNYVISRWSDYDDKKLYFDKIQRNHRLVVVNSDGTLKELSNPQSAINLDISTS